MAFDANQCLALFERLLASDSTTGQYAAVQQVVTDLLDEWGVPYDLVHKGGVIARLGEGGDPVAVTAHLDDIGLMVRHVNADGTLNVCPVGGLYPFYCVGENVRVHTRAGKVFTGTVCRTPALERLCQKPLCGRQGLCRRPAAGAPRALDVQSSAAAEGVFLLRRL